jgi:hypothetical protein
VAQHDRRLFRHDLPAVIDIERTTNPDRAAEVEEAGYVVVPERSSKVVTILSQRASGLRLKTDVGFEPRTTLEEGLLQTAKSYREYFSQRRQHPPVETPNINLVAN